MRKTTAKCPGNLQLGLSDVLNIHSMFALVVLATSWEAMCNVFYKAFYVAIRFQDLKV